MISAEEKALELISTYRYILSLPNAPLGDNKDKIAKECALYLVEQILVSEQAAYTIDIELGQIFVQYWNEVKNNINNIKL
jgi:hypothetical protein